MTNQVFEKDGYVLVADLFWPTPENGKSNDLQKLKTELGVDLSVKVTGRLANNSGCARRSELEVTKGKKIVSLGAFLLNFYPEDSVDVIIVAKLSDDLAGLVAIKNGYVIPVGGDAIGSTETIRATMIDLIDTYVIGSIWTLGFGNYFYDDKDIIGRIRSINPYFSVPINMADGSGEVNVNKDIWNYNAAKKALTKSLMLKIDDSKLLNKSNIILAICLGIAATTSIVGWMLYENYKQRQHEEMMRQLATQKTVELPKSMEMSKFVELCFSGVDNYFGFPGGWELISFSCNLNQRVARFASSYYQEEDLTAALGKTLVFSKNVNQETKTNQFEAVLSETIMPDFVEIAIKPSAQDQVEKLKQLKDVEDIDVRIDFPASFISYQTYKPEAINRIKFRLSSNYSPLWFSDNGYFAGARISNVAANFDKATGFFTWQIDGEI